MSGARLAVLNADVGESFGPWPMGQDEQLMPLVGAVNVACGLHAGDPLVMRKTLRQAARFGADAGAHPGYPDLQGFGRRAMALSPEEVESFVAYQLGALWGAARLERVELVHVKPHGALYNRASVDRTVAEAVARAVSGVNPGLVLVAMAGSELAEAGRRAGLMVAEEAFPDRGYRSDGTLLPRSAPQAVVLEPAEVARRAEAMVLEGRVQAQDGTTLALRADTLCIHGDHPRASEVAAAVRGALQARGVRLVLMREWRTRQAAPR